MAGVSPAAITKACKRALKPALIGKRIDLDHPTVVKYLAGKGVDATSPPETTPAERPRRTRKRPRPGQRAARRELQSIDGLEHLTLEELINRFGTETGLKDWLDSRKKIADIREKDLKNAEAAGRLISREFVKTHVFGHLDAAHRRLLRDTPKSLAKRIYALARAGEPIEAAEAEVREAISDQLRPMKAEATRALRNA